MEHNMPTEKFLREHKKSSIHYRLYDMHSGEISYYEDKESCWIKLIQKI